MTDVQNDSMAVTPWRTITNKNVSHKDLNFDLSKEKITQPCKKNDKPCKENANLINTFKFGQELSSGGVI